MTTTATSGNTFDSINGIITGLGSIATTYNQTHAQVQASHPQTAAQFAVANQQPLLPRAGMSTGAKVGLAVGALLFGVLALKMVKVGV